VVTLTYIEEIMADISGCYIFWLYEEEETGRRRLSASCRG